MRKQYNELLMELRNQKRLRDETFELIEWNKRVKNVL